MIRVDRILKNGRFYGANAEALAIQGERIIAAGLERDILPLAGRATQIDDLGGRFVMAGLVDAHIHWKNTAANHFSVRLYDAPTKAEALRRVAARRETVKTGEWIYGAGWLQDQWSDDPSFPTSADLDAVTGDVPTYLVAKSGHAAWVNSAALRIAGIDDQTPSPSGGQIGRGPQTGILFEAPAMALVHQHMPSIDPEQIAAWMEAVQTEAWACGLTGIHDFDDPSCLYALQRLRERGMLGLRVVKQINDPWIERAYDLGLRGGFGDDWLRLGALKIFADGALGARTAAMIEPYHHEPDNLGIVVTDKETIYEQVQKASLKGFASTIHAIGDKAVHDVLDVLESVRAEEAQRGVARHQRRHRIEHVQLIHPDDMPRLGQLDIIASMQPIHAASDWKLADRYWGGRAKTGYHWRGQLDHGARLAFGSDSPIDVFDPWQGLYSAITRLDTEDQPAGGWYPEACISIEEGLAAYTTGPAWAAGMEDRSGALQTGFLADLIVLDRDPLTIPPEALRETQTLGTMVGGIWRHRLFD